MTRWGMVIDLRRCIGCYTCVISCKQENYLSADVHWSRVLVTESRNYPAQIKEIMPVLCNNCKEAICAEVCPTGATIKREDGIVTVDYDKCMGCRYCVISCPYQQRSYLHEIKPYFPGQGWTPQEEIGKEMYQTGVAVKCEFCVDRIDKGIKEGLKPGIDDEATPACVISCPAKARYFGDLDDPTSEVSRLIKEKQAIQNHPEFGTDPSVYYILH